MFAIENGSGLEALQQPQAQQQWKASRERDGGEQFDLDAIVDDLGSYLGTGPWDVEREAGRLSAHGS
jgi:hypothetical protein